MCAAAHLGAAGKLGAFHIKTSADRPGEYSAGNMKLNPFLSSFERERVCERETEREIISYHLKYFDKNAECEQINK